MKNCELMYSVVPKSSHNRLELKFDGHMEQDPAVFFGEFTSAAASVRDESGEWDLLVDFSNTPVMPQERAENTAKIFQWCLSNNVRRIAFVLTSITQKMQIKRVSQSSDKIEYFEEVGAAERWLA